MAQKIFNKRWYIKNFKIKNDGKNVPDSDYEVILKMDGKTKDEIVQEFGKESFEKFAKDFMVTPKENKENFDNRYMHRPFAALLKKYNDKGGKR